MCVGGVFFICLFFVLFLAEIFSPVEISVLESSTGKWIDLFVCFLFISKKTLIQKCFYFAFGSCNPGLGRKSRCPKYPGLIHLGYP